MVLVVTVVAVAYGTASPQLAVAEFAPAARNSPDAPPTTSPGDGARSAANRGGRAAATTTVSSAAESTATTGLGQTGPPTSRVGRARPCYGSPPRQTEDLLSPACLATVFEGDNGGSTSTGVSGTEIRIAVPVTSLSAVPRQTLDALFEFFNRKFELYGRRLVPVYVQGKANDALTSRTLGADAAAAGVFGALTGPLEVLASYPQVALVQELARNHVVTVAHNKATWWSDRALFDAFHPYVWSVYPAAERVQQSLAAVACPLAGKPAQWTDDPDLAGKPRRIGIFAAGHQVSPSVNLLTSQLETCTGEPPVVATWTEISDPSYTSLRSVFSGFADAGVTTVICACEYMYVEYGAWLGGKPTGFEPEWILPNNNYALGEERLLQIETTYEGGYVEPPVLVQSGPRLTALQDRPWFAALVETNPDLLRTALAGWEGAFALAEFAYPQLLVLASGIQAAGPALTPETFAAGLMSSTFPNPSAGQAPQWQPSVGFGPGDHSFYDDFAIAWWSRSAPAIEPNSEPQGSWCYVGAGTRFTSSSVPGNLSTHLFNRAAPCR